MRKSRPLITRLRAARRILKRDRQALYDSERRPAENDSVDTQAQQWLDEYDEALQAVAEAIEMEAGRG